MSFGIHGDTDGLFAANCGERTDGYSGPEQDVLFSSSVVLLPASFGDGCTIAG